MRIADDDSGRTTAPPSAAEPLLGVRRRIWCETLTPVEVSRPAVLRLLREYELQLVMAVRPNTLEAVPALLQACEATGVDVALWPMLDDDDGRWLSIANAVSFAAFVDRVLEHCDGSGVAPREVALDLEPPIRSVRELTRLHFVRAISQLRPRASGSNQLRDDATDITTITRRLLARGIRPWAAVVPLVLADAPGSGGWQRVLGTPVDSAHLHRVNSMLYSSLAVGYGGRWIRRQDVEHLLFESARACVRRWGSRAAASLGAVGVGALGDETVYAGPEELARDVTLVRAAGVRDLALFELGGVLARGPATAWLDAFCQTDSGGPIPKRTRRAGVTTALAIALSRLAHR